MDELRQLRNLSRPIKKNRDAAVKLGDAIREVMDNQISPRHKLFHSIDQLWNQLLPAELARHCKLTDISGGQLKVLVDSPAYMYELQLCSYQLLEELQRQCPRARIRKIKPIIG